MAGHSKFKNIQHRKGAQDAKRNKIFTKVGREIMVAAKLGGGDPDGNPRLRAAIAAGRAVDMPNHRIKSAIDAAIGSGNTEDYQNIRYEGYGPGGVAIIVETLTDNRNRTVGDIRSYFSKLNGALGETNSVSFMFDHVGEIFYPSDKATADAIFEAAVDAGADNCESDEDGHTVTCAVNALGTVRDALEKKFGESEKSGFVWRPNVQAEVDEETAATVLKLIDLLEDHDDVQEVFTNFEVSDEVMERLMA